MTGANNQLLSDGTYNYQYDAEGNRTKRTNIATNAVDDYTWDYRNRLTAVTSKDAGGVVTQTVGYEYDVDDQRVSKTVNGVVEKYYLDGNQIAFVTDAAGNQTFHYLYGLNVDAVMAQDSPTGMVWSLSDRLGSVNLLADGSGAVVDKRTFDSFGRVLSETNPSVKFRYGYTGREQDQETGLDYYRARYYDAANGRFISVDPAGFGAGDTNLYRYVGNSSTMYTDPTGEFGLPSWNDVQDYAYGGLVNTDKFVAGFADLVTGGYTTKLRNEVYGDKVEGQHEGWQFTAGQVAGFGVTATLGFVTPNALVGSIGAAERAAQGYTIAQAGIGAYNTTTKIENGQIDWHNPLSYLEVAGSYAPLIGFGAKMAINGVSAGTEALLNPSALTGFDNWLASGTQGGLQRNLGAIRANSFKNNSTVFYHASSESGASSIINNGIDLAQGRFNADFGRGFYMTTDKALAGWTTERIPGIIEPSFATFRVGNKKLETLSKLEFNNPSSEWADFVTLNKKYIGDNTIFTSKASQLQWMHGGEHYDMVVGPFAKRLVSDYRYNAWAAKDIQGVQLNTDPIQISIHTNKAIDIFNQAIRK